ncbi:MAG: phytanoyl-CoA dioxygenase family protein [Gammaproteobacteria bacterium]
MTTETPSEKTAFTNAYGGFWTDLQNSLDLLAGKLELGWISEDEARLLRDWIHNGYVVIPNAIPDNLIDAVNSDIERVLNASPSVCRTSFWRDGKKFWEPAVKEHMLEEEAKLLDLHMVSEAARRAIFSERVHRFLTLVFERLPVAFQSLSFEYGSQQPTHCDIAFVHVSSPREFIASWIALEDIEPGSGELQYYPGSHRLGDVVFENDSVWAAGDLSKYSDGLDKAAASAGLELQRFTPSKGDVLLWSSGLYHGGSPRTNHQLSRKSLVTHYLPRGRQPQPPIDPTRIFPTNYKGFVCSEGTPLMVIQENPD